ESKVRQCVFVSATPADYEKDHAGQVVEQLVRPTGLVDPEVIVRPASTQVDDVLSEIRAVTTEGWRVLVTTLTKRMAEDLTDFLSEHGVRVRYLHSDIDTVEDRKSTRLNSSHVKISYAVFCLKKKQQTDELRHR